MRIPFLSRRRDRRRSRGQSLVEFALVLPVLLLIMLIVIDAGRLFFGSVTLHNAARIAASYAASHPHAWGAAPDANVQLQYEEQIDRDTDALCEPVAFADPSFPDGKELGMGAEVTLECDFQMLTPVIGDILGSVVTIKATEIFPIRFGLLDTVPTFGPGPAPTATPTPAPTPTPTPTATPGPSGSPGPSPSPTLAPGVCIVPTIIGERINDVVPDWSQAGFNATQLNVAVGTGNYRVQREWIGSVFSVWDGTEQQCATFQLNVGP